MLEDIGPAVIEPAVIEKALRDRSPWSFEPMLEARYQHKHGTARQRRLASALRVCAVLVVGGIGSDAFNGLEHLPLMLAWRIGLASIFVAASLLLRVPRRRWQEALLVGVPTVLMLVLTAAAGQDGTGEVAVRYKMAAVVSVAGLLVSSPVRLSTASGVAAAALLVFPVMLWLVPGPASLSTSRDLPLFALGAMAVTLLVVRGTELSRRRNYLNLLRYEAAASELRALNAELSRLSTTDALTGLPNRRHFEAEARRAWHDRRGEGIGICLIDVDWFKAFNDSAGHEAGDACLRRVADGLAAVMRQQEDLLARYGGEEFAVLLPRTTREGLAGIGERLRAGVAALALAHPGRGGRPVTVSLGVAWHAAAAHGDLETLLRDADRALYAAKATGRNCVVLAGVEPVQPDACGADGGGVSIVSAAGVSSSAGCSP